jgi:predicted HD phosphohydrolase
MVRPTAIGPQQQAPDAAEPARLTRMIDGTPEQFRTMLENGRAFGRATVDRLFDHLQILAGDDRTFAVDRLAHSLQTATRALRDGRDDEYVVCALFHDVGEVLGAANHAEISAAILEPYVSGQNCWMVARHGEFQGHFYFHHLGLDPDLRERHRGHPWFDHTADFCRLYDQNSFDPDYDTLPLEHFEPMVRQVLRRPRRSIYLMPSEIRRDTPDQSESADVEA